MEPQPTTEIWHYIGRCTLSKGNAGVSWCDPTGHRLSFAANKRTKATVIGGAYEVTVIRSGEGVSLRGSPSYKGGAMHPDSARWAAEDSAWQIDKDRQTTEKKQAGQDLYHEALRVLRGQYLAMPARYRTALLADIIHGITRG